MFHGVPNKSPIFHKLTDCKSHIFPKMPPLCFSDLPTDIIWCIAAHLPRSSYISLQRTSRHLASQLRLSFPSYLSRFISDLCRTDDDAAQSSLITIIIPALTPSLTRTLVGALHHHQHSLDVVRSCLIALVHAKDHVIFDVFLQCGVPKGTFDVDVDSESGFQLSTFNSTYAGCVLHSIVAHGVLSLLRHSVQALNINLSNKAHLICTAIMHNKMDILEHLLHHVHYAKDILSFAVACDNEMALHMLLERYITPSFEHKDVDLDFAKAHRMAIYKEQDGCLAAFDAYFRRYNLT
jgi:hypothetical protein